jgi:hypothetical protein
MLYESLKEHAKTGNWDSWVHNALETGDPQFWPQIREFYRKEPKFRWTIVTHLRFYWGEHENLVAPLLKEALRDPEQCAAAFEAVETFPALAEDVVAALNDPEVFSKVDSVVLPVVAPCLRAHPELAMSLVKAGLRDPRSAWAALHAASIFPSLADHVVACLHDHEFVRTVGPDAIVACLAGMFGLAEAPSPKAFFAWGGVDPILDSVRTELLRRYSLDLDRHVSDVSSPDS